MSSISVAVYNESAGFVYRMINAQKNKCDHRDCFETFPCISLGHFVLRDMRISDYEEYYEIFNDQRVNQFLSDEDIPRSIADAKEEIQFWSGLFHKKKSIFWGITDKETDKLIGTIGFNAWHLDSNRAEIAYDLSSKYWRQGIMSLALRAVIDFAFAKMHISRIEAKTMLHNIASIGILKRFHFQEVSILRNYRKVRGRYIDVYLYALSKQDCIHNTHEH